MSRKKSPPSYLKKKVAGKLYARTKLHGQEISLGLYGTEESYQKFEEVRARWRAGGDVKPSVGLTITDLAASWMEYVEKTGLYRRPDGSVTTELEGWCSSLLPLRRLFGSKLARDFGPRDLKTLRDSLANGSWMKPEERKRGTRAHTGTGYCRKTINQRIRRVVRLFAFGVSEDLVPVTVHQALLTVDMLPAGSKVAKDYAEVEPVPLQDVRDTLPCLPLPDRDMALLQLATGMRPGEVCAMRRDEIDRRGVKGSPSFWAYRPTAHKTAGHGIKREIVLGPGAQMALAHHLRGDGEWVFSAAVGGPYRVNTYVHHILAAARSAGVPDWTPNQLRKTAATETEERFDLDHARAQLGHTSTSTTKKFYAKADLQKAARAARLG